MKTNKIFAVLALTLIALSAAGYAYAHWSDEVYLEGDVYTGSLEIVISDKDQEIWVWVEGQDWVEQDMIAEYYGPDPEDPTNPEHPAYLGKEDVMKCTDAWVGRELLPEDLCVYAPEKCVELTMYKAVKFTLENAYPETAFETYMHIHNVGSIPAHWIGCTATLWAWEDTDSDGVPDTWVEVTPAYFSSMGIEVWAEAYDAAGDPIPGISYDPKTGKIVVDGEHQFHPCEGIDVYITFYFTDFLPECRSFRGELVFDFVQWNWKSVMAQPTIPQVK